MADKTIPASSCEVSRVGEHVVLMLETPSDDKNLAAVMSAKEARRLVNRLGKAANDAASHKARAQKPT